MAYKWGVTNWDDPASRILILQPRNKVTATSTASATDLEPVKNRPKSPGIFVGAEITSHLYGVIANPSYPFVLGHV